MPQFSSSALATTVAATSTIIYFCLIIISCVGMGGGHTIINDIIPIANISIPLVKILREGVIRANCNLCYSDNDIKTIISIEKHRSIHQLLTFPLSVSLVSITDESPNGFEIVIEPSIVSNPTKKLSSALDVIVESSL